MHNALIIGAIVAVVLVLAIVYYRRAKASPKTLKEYIDAGNSPPIGVEVVGAEKIPFTEGQAWFPSPCAEGQIARITPSCKNGTNTKLVNNGGYKCVTVDDKGNEQWWPCKEAK